MSQPAESLSSYHPGGHHPVHLGDTFHDGKYTILHKLGYGAYATVWLARDHSREPPQCVALKCTVARPVSQESNEIKILDYLQGLLCPTSPPNPSTSSPPGSEKVLGLLDHFIISGPNGVHDVLVLEIVGPSPNELREGNSDGELFVWLHAREISKQVAMGLTYLHECEIVHGDLHPNNIAFAIPELVLMPGAELLDFLGKPLISESEIPDGQEETTKDALSHPRYRVAPTSFKDYMIKVIRRDPSKLPWAVKIIDFGGAFFTRKVPNENHAPLSFRAPELVFNTLSGGTVERDWAGPMIDVWALGCFIYEIVTQDSLITTYMDDSSEVNWICGQYIKKVGALPERWQPFWSPEDGKVPKTKSLKRYLKSPYLETYRELTGDDMDDLHNLLRKLLGLDPTRRAEVSNILQHRWLKDKPTISPAALRRWKDDNDSG